MRPGTIKLSFASTCKKVFCNFIWVFVWLGQVLSGMALSSADARAAQAADVLVDDAQWTSLAKSVTWQRLLHMTAQGHSEIRSPSFFLSPTGRTDAVAELRATVAAYVRPWPQDTNLHPRCMFPARYFWLSQQISLPGYKAHDERCSRLEDWGRFAHLKSISVYLVSGYFGNPASTFGHALIKFNSDDMSRLGGLMDISVNFGALVPDNELTLVYVAKGLFGGYRAAFSDKFHYTNDVVYGRTEFRDMWDYELKLTDTERTLLAFHIAEISGQKFDYFFLSENCGYRIAELLELATGRPVISSGRVWYAPVEMFHALQRTADTNDSMLVHLPRFVPSAERVLNNEFAQLNSPQASVANAAIRDELQNLDQHLSILPLDERLDVLDALLAYQAYKVAGEGSKVDERVRQAKDRILLARLQQPARNKMAPPIPLLPSPAQGHSPMAAAFGLGVDQDKGPFTQFKWAPFNYEPYGFHGLENGELAVFDATFGVDGRHHLWLDQLDVIRVMKLNTRTVNIDGESSLSWRVQLGHRRLQHDGAWGRQNHLSGGVGRAAQWGGMTVYAMLGGSLQSGASQVSWGGRLGLLLTQGDWKYQFHGDLRRDVAGGRARYREGGLDIVRRLNRDQALHLGWSHNGSSRVVVAFQQYW